MTDPLADNRSGMEPIIRAVLTNLLSEAEAAEIDIIANDVEFTDLEKVGKTWEIVYRHPERWAVMGWSRGNSGLTTSDAAGSATTSPRRSCRIATFRPSRRSFSAATVSRVRRMPRRPDRTPTEHVPPLRQTCPPPRMPTCSLSSSTRSGTRIWPSTAMRKRSSTSSFTTCECHALPTGISAGSKRKGSDPRPARSTKVLAGVQAVVKGEKAVDEIIRTEGKSFEVAAANAEVKQAL